MINYVTYIFPKLFPFNVSVERDARKLVRIKGAQPPRQPISGIFQSEVSRDGWALSPASPLHNVQQFSEQGTNGVEVSQKIIPVPCMVIK